MNKMTASIVPITRVLGALMFSVLLHHSVARAADETPKKLPPAKEVIAKFVKAIGGKEAVLKQSSTHSLGKMEMPAQGLSGTLDSYAAKPNKVLVTMDITGIGKSMQGFDGKVGWSIDPAQGPMVLKDKALEQAKAEADFYAPLHDESSYTSMETVEATKFEGKDCYKLKLVRKNGHETIEFYDVKTALLNGTISTQESPMGSIPVTSVMGEYKDFGGVKSPTKISLKFGPAEIVLTITSVEINKVADSAFELPAPIKALVKP